MKNRPECLSKNTISRFINEVSDLYEQKKRLGEEPITIGPDSVICYHSDNLPRCAASGYLLLDKPVLASDGRLYELESLIDETDEYKQDDSRLLKPIFNKKVYIHIKIACKNYVFSKIDPRVVLHDGKCKIDTIDNKLMFHYGALVFFGENRGANSRAVVFVEKRVPCEEIGGNTYYTGKITAYSFINRNTEYNNPSTGRTVVRNAKIDIKPYEGIDYSQITQSELLDNTFNINPIQIFPRSYGCTDDHITALETRIAEDHEGIILGKIRYHDWLADKWLINFFKTHHHSFSWARDILRSANILQDAEDIESDENFPMIARGSKSPYQPICISSWKDNWIGSRQERIAPKHSLFNCKQRNSEEKKQNCKFNA